MRPSPTQVLPQKVIFRVNFHLITCPVTAFTRTYFLLAPRSCIFSIAITSREQRDQNIDCCMHVTSHSHGFATDEPMDEVQGRGSLRSAPRNPNVSQLYRGRAGLPDWT